MRAERRPGAIRRGAREQLRVPAARHRSQLRRRDGDRNQDQGEQSCNGHGRHYRVHDHAQLAVIRIRIGRVGVRHLRHREQSQQRQAYQRSNREHPVGRASAVMEAWLQSG